MAVARPPSGIKSDQAILSEGMAFVSGTGGTFWVLLTESDGTFMRSVPGIPVIKHMSILLNDCMTV